MASFNRWVGLGNLTRDPELKYTPAGKAVLDISLAVNDRYKDASGQWVDKCDFIDVTLFGRTAEVAAEYLRKGSPVLIEGKLRQEQWQDKEGNRRQKLKVVSDQMQMLGQGGGGSSGQSRSQSQSSRSAPPQGDGDSFGPPEDDSDIPF